VTMNQHKLRLLELMNERSLAQRRMFDSRSAEERAIHRSHYRELGRSIEELLTELDLHE